MNYISNRPGVEVCSGQGLFTDEGESIVLSHVQKEAAEHHGVIWTHEVSLRREETVRLGYDNERAWRDFLHSKRAYTIWCSTDCWNEHCDRKRKGDRPVCCTKCDQLLDCSMVHGETGM